MTFEHKTLTELRLEAADITTRVRYKDTCVIVTKHGKDLVAIISLEELEKLVGKPIELSMPDVDTTSSSGGQ
jgi:prevent-host-death family protein